MAGWRRRGSPAGYYIGLKPNCRNQSALIEKGNNVSKRKVGDKKPCIRAGCKKKAVCIAVYTDHCMGTLEEMSTEEWKCSCSAEWKQSTYED